MASAQTVATFALECSYQLMKSGLGHEHEFAALRDRRPVSKNSTISMFDCVQDLLPTAAEEFDIYSQFTIDFADQRKSALEPLARSQYFKSHHLAELLCVFAVENAVFAHVISLQILYRKINSSPGKISADILPEIRELQPRASEIRKLLA